MEFRMLGPLEAWHDGASVPLGDQQQRFILVVLLLHANRPVSPDRLTEIVWGDPARRDLVRSYINRLRQAFRDTDVGIETTPTGYLLRVGEDQLDTNRFDRLRADAETARAEDPRQAIGLLRQAVGLWRGGFIEDIDIDRVGGTDVFIPHDSYVDAVGDLAELELASGDHRSARDRLRPRVQGDPARQRLAELLIRALLVNGDRVEAIRVYDRTHDALDELGIAPGPALRNLKARAEQGEPPSSLPSRPGAFTGRATEIAAIEASQGRAVWVSGPPGVGKTGLAVEAAHRLRDRFPDGQLMARLNGFTPGMPATTVGDALTQLLVELGVPAEQVPATVGRKASLYQTTLVGTRTLVVLDNAASPDQIRPLLPETPDCFAIVTSRRMGDPDTGEHVRLTPLPPADATRLFRALTDPRRVGARTDDVTAIVERCGYLPMQIQVAAALFSRHDQWPLAHLRGLLDERTSWDTAAVRVSYRQLDDPQQDMFRLLGHIPGPDLHVTGAAALADRDVANARMLLDDLHEVSLLEEVAPERYQMLDPLKEFAAAEQPAGHAGAVLRLLDFYLVTLAAAVEAGYPFDRGQPATGDRSSPVAPRFTDQNAALGWIAAERDNLVAAIRYAVTHDLPGHAWRLAVLMWRYFNTNSQLEDWLETMDLVWQLVSADENNEYGQAHVLLRLAIAHDRLGRLAEALELAAAALPKWIRLGDVRGEATTLCALAIPTLELGNHDQAIAHLDAALTKYEQIDDPRGHAHALSNLGYLNELHGNLDLAQRQLRDAARALHAIDHTRGIAHTLNNLGAVQQKLGLLDDALASHTEAHRHAIDAGDQCAVAYALNNIGNTHRRAGRLAEATRYQERARDVAVDVPDADLRTQLYLDRGTTARAKGDAAGALHAYGAALDLAASTGNRTYQARAHRDLAETLHASGDHDTAVPHWRTAEATYDDLNLPAAREVHTERAALTCSCRAIS